MGDGAAKVVGLSLAKQSKVLLLDLFAQFIFDDTKLPLRPNLTFLTSSVDFHYWVSSLIIHSFVFTRLFTFSIVFR